MTWQEIIDDPQLSNLLFKVETNEFGQLILTRAAFLHGVYQTRVAQILESFLPDGMTSFETAINTRKGTKVPDVTWFDYEFFERYRAVADLPVAPPICVGIISKNNSIQEINGKRKLYFERDAQEIWTCDLEGNVRFYNQNGELENSSLAPDFPRKIELSRPAH